jgi:hypothetical protein
VVVDLGRSEIEDCCGGAPAVVVNVAFYRRRIEEKNDGGEWLFMVAGDIEQKREGTMMVVGAWRRWSKMVVPGVQRKRKEMKVFGDKGMATTARLPRGNTNPMIKRLPVINRKSAMVGVCREETDGVGCQTHDAIRRDWCGGYSWWPMVVIGDDGDGGFAWWCAWWLADERESRGGWLVLNTKEKEASNSLLRLVTLNKNRVL